MNRLRFRVWDKEVQEFAHWPVYFNLTNSEIVTELWYGYEIQIEEPLQDSNYIVLQSTGLFDKNGTEIYEGDIVKFKNPYDKRFNAFGVVVWREDKACFGMDMAGTTEQFELYRITAENYLTVIGNIYQDEHLLGEE
ncbi:YopX family protein [Mammaliicoccus sciuri]|uniref:YopX family protein n=1 Tax=Mammaliicoccus sciuri TaxID=1296 RepID=UPI00397CC353